MFNYTTRHPEVVQLSDRDVMVFIPDLPYLLGNDGFEMTGGQGGNTVLYSGTAKASANRFLLWARSSGEELVSAFRYVQYITGSSVDSTTVRPLREVFAPRVVYDRDRNFLYLWFWTNVKADYLGVDYVENQLFPIGYSDYEKHVYPARCKRVLCFAVGTLRTCGVQGGFVGGGALGYQGIQGFQGQDDIQGMQDRMFDIVPLFSRPKIISNVRLNNTGLQGVGLITDGWYLPYPPEGLQGFQGPQGATGAQGVQGPTGYVKTGFQGYMGCQGLPGGPMGATGATGNQGKEGPQGQEGGPGPPGFPGPQGPRGPIGPQGSQGAQGPLGPQGFQGPRGITGFNTGPTGPQGPLPPFVPSMFVLQFGIQGPISYDFLHCGGNVPSNLSEVVMPTNASLVAMSAATSNNTSYWVPEAWVNGSPVVLGPPMNSKTTGYMVFQDPIDIDAGAGVSAYVYVWFGSPPPEDVVVLFYFMTR